MKKLLASGALLLSAVIIHTTGNNNTKALSDRMNLNADNITDTVPKDTTKKDTMFSQAVAYRFVTDTVPKDTTKKDTSFQALAYNR